MFGNDMDWNIHQSNNSQASGEPSVELLATSHGKSTPKPRKKFTISNTLLENSTPPACEADDLLVTPSKSSSSVMSFGSFSSLIKDKRSLHGSMENLHKPKNHRSDCRLNDLSAKTKDNTEMNGRLIQENMTLLKLLEDTRKQTLGLQVARAFSFQAFRGQRDQNATLKADKRRKEEECAARMILHNLLLNSWRNCKAELDNLLDDNFELNKTMENLSLQLRVVRHLQTVEKENALDKTIEVDRMKTEVSDLKKDNEKSHSDMERMESELNSLQENIQNLQEQNRKFETDAKTLTEENKMVGRALELEKSKTEELADLNKTVKNESSRLEVQLKEVTRQNNHWQERARTFESESWELKMDIDSRNMKIKEIKAACDALREEKANLIRRKSVLKEQLDETAEKLEQTNFDKDELIVNLHTAKDNMKEQVHRIESLESSLKNAKKEFTEVERELFTYKLQNVKRRREWANALYFIVNPVDAIRRSFTAVKDDSLDGNVCLSKKSI